MLLGYSRNSSKSGNVLCHRCSSLAERSQLQAEFCKQPWLLVLAVWLQGFGKPTESPTWYLAAGQPKSSLLSKRWLLANSGTLSISIQTPLAACSNGLDTCKCQGHSWCFDTRFPKLCHGSLTSRRAFSSFHSSYHVCRQTSVFCLDNTLSSLGEL